MILKRKKIFSRRVPLPAPFPIPQDWDGKYDDVEYRVSIVDKTYNNEMKEFGLVDKAKVRALKKDLENGYIYSDGPAGGDTHYLEDRSLHPDKFHVMSKSINTCDRMNYGVYQPVLDEDNRLVIIPITIWAIKGHTIYGQGEYSETDN